MTDNSTLGTTAWFLSSLHWSLEMEAQQNQKLNLGYEDEGWFRKRNTPTDLGKMVNNLKV